MTKIPITVAYGDGIGPEIMKASLRVMEAAGAAIEPEDVTIGEKVYLSGNTTGITPEFWESIRRTKVFYKAPLTTPQGKGYKSINVTIRKTLNLFANVRPVRSLHPFVETRHPDMDVVIIRENEEDLYAAIEHRQTPEVFQCLKLITRPGSERIVRYAFEYARANNRKRVTCMTKDNIMKLTDGLFHKVFDEIAPEYPDIETDHLIIDIGTARVADTPEAFDVIVVANLYGDIISDVTAQLSGSVGLGRSANIGENMSMFEAIHGSAPDIAGQGIANPSGLLMAGVMMLVHIGQPEVAEKIHNAYSRTMEDGIHTGDIYREGLSKQRVSTAGFADAVIERLGQKPEMLPAVTYARETGPSKSYTSSDSNGSQRNLVGTDVFLYWDEGDRSPDELGKNLAEASNDDLALTMITNRGLKVWPNGSPETFCTDHWRCRFQPTETGQPVTQQQIIDLLQRVHAHNFDIIKTEQLYTFDGVPGFSLGQGQ
ncbi:MAG: NADP-dependent isocitrate dehydrogenase [Chloroflexota bacterium]